MNKEIKLQTKILVVSICLVVLTVIGSSYAAFVWSDSGTSQNISSGNYVIEIENTTGNSISLSGAYPMSDEEGETTTSYKFTVHNKSNTDVEFKLKLENDTSKTNTMDTSNIKVYLTGASTIEPRILNLLTNNILDSGYLNANSSKTYELRVWIDENASNDTIGKEYNGKLTLDTKQIQISDVEYQKGDVNMNGIIDPIDAQMVDYYIKRYIEFNSIQKQLADAFVNDMNIINQQDVSAIKSKVATNLLTRKLGIMDPIPSNNHNPNFSTDSTDNGMFVQVKDKAKTDNGYPIFYYRGNVENNYVQLGTYKSDITNQIYSLLQDEYGDYYSPSNVVVAHENDPILWRVVGVNYDGSIKLIAEYNIGLSQRFNESTSEGYMSNYIKDDGSNSEIKDSLETWYNTHISVDKNVDSKIIKGNYCNDISGNYVAAFNRIENRTPIFICPENSIIANEKVGLLTADELMYAGAFPYPGNTVNVTYLNNNTDFWTMTPYRNAHMYRWSVESHLTHDMLHISWYGAARPVITLKPNVEVTGSGDGTKDNPYIIKL